MMLNMTKKIDRSKHNRIYIGGKNQSNQLDANHLRINQVTLHQQNLHPMHKPLS